jgi:hypothetical protein
MGLGSRFMKMISIKPTFIVKNSCIEATQILIEKLKRQFLEQETMMTLEIIYPQYWLNLVVVEGSFLLHLSVIKSTICVVHRTIEGITVPFFLDSHVLDV